MDITNYDIERKNDDCDRALKVTCETARLPVKIIFELKENSFNIFNENSKFLICRPLMQTEPTDSGWYIFRNITENDNESRMTQISNLQDDIIDGDFTDLQDLTDDSEQNEIIGTNLKQLIERELITGV